MHGLLGIFTGGRASWAPVIRSALLQPLTAAVIQLVMLFEAWSFWRLPHPFLLGQDRSEPL